MDILTQALLGGVLAQAVASKNEKKIATLTGCVAGVIADADILIQSSADPLLTIEYHRHFSHSLFFIPVGAVIALMLLWPFLRRRISVSRLYLFCFAGFSLSGVLDACTSYGTHLLWPFSDERIAWNIIAIIDPVFTIALLITLVLGLRIKYRQVAYWGLSFSLAYMLAGYLQLQRATSVSVDLAEKRGHTIKRHVVKPTLGNLLLWRSVYIHQDRIYVDAVRVGLLDGSQVYEGEAVRRFSLERDLPGLDMSSVLSADIQRFKTFSDGYLAYDPGRNDVIGDMRYSILPNSARPLWGIIIDSEKPQQHAPYKFFRDTSQKVRTKFFNMMLGRCESTPC